LIARAQAGQKPIAASLWADPGSFGKVANVRIEVSASMVFRVPRLLDAPFDDLLAGRFMPGSSGCRSALSTATIVVVAVDSACQRS